jgi:hypothetical protein
MNNRLKYIVIACGAALAIIGYLIFASHPSDKDFKRLFDQCSIKYSHDQIVNMKNVFSNKDIESLKSQLLFDLEKMEKRDNDSITKIKEELDTIFATPFNKKGNAIALDLFHEWKLIDDEHNTVYPPLSFSIDYINHYKSNMSDDEERTINHNSTLKMAEIYQKYLESRMEYYNKHNKWSKNNSK